MVPRRAVDSRCESTGCSSVGIRDEAQDRAVWIRDERGHYPPADVRRRRVDGRTVHDDLVDRGVDVVDAPVDLCALRDVRVRQEAELVAPDVEADAEGTANVPRGTTPRR